MPNSINDTLAKTKQKLMHLLFHVIGENAVWNVRRTKEREIKKTKERTFVTSSYLFDSFVIDSDVTSMPSKERILNCFVANIHNLIGFD